MKNEPAFPTDYDVHISGPKSRDTKPVLTKRELFAAMAMQGIVSCEQIHNYMVNPGESLVASLSEMDVGDADALIARLEKSNSGSKASDQSFGGKQ